MNTQYSCGCGSGCRRGMAREGNRSCPPQSQAAPGSCMTPCPQPAPAPCAAPRPQTVSAPCAASLPPVAMAYVPMQVWRNLYSACDALAQGTLFSELNLPFLGREGLRSVC